jgi:hypothetical protein
MLETSLQAATLHSLAFAVMTGSTCGDMCWHAREEVCRCSCGGANHGILTKGGAQPKRTCKIENFYELVAVIPGRAVGECWNDVERRIRAEIDRVIAERFPGIDSWAYGNYREEKYFPVLDRKISPSQAKWDEVKAVPNAARLIWARPAGTRYLKRGPNHKAVYSDQA